MGNESIDDLFGPETLWGDIEKFQGRERLFGFLANPQTKEDLVAYMKQKGPYEGDNPNIMLAIFDTLHDNEEVLSYGLKGFEKLNRDPKALLELKHPNRLIDYVMIISNDIPELSKLLGEFRDAMNYLEYKSHNFSYYDKKYSKLQLSIEELAQQVIVIGTGVANHIGHMTFKSYIQSAFEIEEEKTRQEALNKMSQLRDAYNSMALAAQILGSKQLVLDYMGLHDETGGGYEIKGIPHEILDKYASHKCGMDTASTGKVPKRMKYDRLSSPLNNIIFGLSHYDIFRLEHFTEVPDLSKEPKEETSAKIQPAADEDFALFGINRETPWEKAHKEYRSLMMGLYSAVFNSPSLHQNTGEVQKFNDAFDRIRKFYIEKATQKQQSEA